MKTIKMSVLPEIAKGLQDLQMTHNLPINLTLQRPIEGRIVMVIEYEEDDELLVELFTDNWVDKIAEGISKLGTK